MNFSKYIYFVLPFLAATVEAENHPNIITERNELLDSRAINQQITNLRVEGDSTTIYELPILSGPRNITTASGGTHHCDGTNLEANPHPGNTCTDSLDAASKIAGFTYDGTYSTQFDDFFITRIGPDSQTATKFWGLLLNYQFTPVGGCQQETQPGDHVLWAYDAFSKAHFLKVTPSIAVVKKGRSLTVTVTDGSSGAVIPGAVINGVTTNASGVAVLTFSRIGLFTYKATRSDSLRSNALVVTVI